MYSERVINIYQCKQDGLKQKEIAAEVNLSEGYINQIICSDEYRSYVKYMEETDELVQTSSPKERTRYLVEELLSSAEAEMKACKTTKDKLLLIETVKQLVSVIGIETDDSQGINVVEVPEMMDKDSFNRRHAKTTGPDDKVETGQEIPLDKVKGHTLPHSMTDVDRDDESTVIAGDLEEILCTGTQLAKGTHTQNPKCTSVEPQGYETPSPSYISENLWDDIKVPML